MAEAVPRPRKRRAALKPAIREHSDSEDDFPKKRSRKCISDDEYNEVCERDSTKRGSKFSSKTRDSRKRRLSPTKHVRQELITSKETCDYNDEPKDENPEEEPTDLPHASKDSAEAAVFKNKRLQDETQESMDGYVQMEWSESDLLADFVGLDHKIAANLVRLFEGDNTIPFIARYRKELTGNMEPEQLRHSKEVFEELRLIQQRAASLIKSIDRQQKLTPSVRRSIISAKSLSELELINAPFKTGSKRTLAERARQLGLESAALAILEGSDYIDLSSLVQKDKEGLSNIKEVQAGIQHIIADVISKDRGVLDFISNIRKNANIRLESCQAKGTVTKELSKLKENSSTKTRTVSGAEKKKLLDKVSEESKYRNYFNFSMNIKYIKPHQILAINRGENQKELSVRVVVPDFILNKLISFCHQQWLSKGVQYELRSILLNESIKDSYNRLIHPLVVRQIRSELSKNAERASIEVFTVNLKKLLLMPPFRGHAVLGIDPGFRNGCKVALVGVKGNILETGIFNLNCGRRTWHLQEDSGALWLQKIMSKHKCEVIALGNGTACRETEEFLSELIQTGFFKPFDVSYTIINEQGASIYSCSDEAKEEFPFLDPNFISAVSIARRLQDPLAELVKVEPKHLGVGMYQHDVSEKKLSNTLNEVVVECVSFVGIDLNTAPRCLLRRVAGINMSRADKILEYRKKHGPFYTREDVKKVKGIGDKSFEQCAGFIRIIPETIGKESALTKCNPLDRTWIHPESYSTAKRFLEYCGLNVGSIGTAESITSINKAVARGGGVAAVATMMNASQELLKLIIDGLQMTNHDFRSDFEKPLFRRGLTSINELESGDILTGRVTNTTHFGAFVDIGVGQNGLIHSSGMGGKHPQCGDRVQVKVLNVELNRQRIGLQLLAIL